jgi:hypothetical protein
MDNVYVASGTSAVLVSVLLQILKNTAYFPWISRNTARANTIISFLAAFGTSLGIVATFDFNSSSGNFSGTFHGNIWDILHVGAHTAIQWATQHSFYKGFVVPAETLGEIRAYLARLLPPPMSEGAIKAREEVINPAKP